MKNIKIDLSSIDYTKPISFYSKLYNLSVSAIRNRFKQLGIYKNFHYTKNNTSLIKKEINKNQYEKFPNKCKNCFSILSYEKRKNKYCCRSCSSTDSQKEGKRIYSEEYKQKLRDLAKKNPFFNGERKLIDKKSYYCNNCNIEFYTKRKNQKCCSRKCFEEWNKKTGYLKGKSGGIREGAGRSKSGWYKGYYCNSSWELAWVIYSLDHNELFDRNTTGFDYTNSKGKISKYYPDFLLRNTSTYVEIKGYKEKEFENKQRFFPEKILIFDKISIKPILNYVENNYGKNFIEMYDGNPHNLKTKKCLICGQSAKFKYCSRICSGKGVRKLKDSVDSKLNIE